MVLHILLTLLILTYSPGFVTSSGCSRINRDTVGCENLESFNGTFKSIVVQSCSDLTILDDSPSFGPWNQVTNITFNCTVSDFPWSIPKIFPNIQFMYLPECNLTTLPWQKVYSETLELLDISQCPMECSCRNQWMKADGAFKKLTEPLSLRKCLPDCDQGVIKPNKTMIVGERGENVTIHVEIKDELLDRKIDKPYFEWAFAKNQHNYREVITKNGADLIITNLTREDIGLIGVRCWHCMDYLVNKIELRVKVPVKVEFVEKTRGDTDLLVVQGYPIDNLTLAITRTQSNQSQLKVLDKENDAVFFSSLSVRPEKRSIFYQRTYRIFTKDTAEGDHLAGDLRFEVCTVGSCDAVEKHVSHLGTTNTEVFIDRNYNDIIFVMVFFSIILFVACSGLAIYYQKSLRSFVREKVFTSFRKRLSLTQDLQRRRASQETEETLLRLEERSSLASDYANLSIPFIDMGLIKIHEKIGSGQFGQVYCGSWEKTGNRSIAIKALKQYDHELEKEARTLFRLDHPNVVRMYGMTRNHLNLLLVFEFMNLGDLRTYLKKRKPTDEYLQFPPGLDILEVKKISFQILKGVQYLKEQQLVHRDLAARNVLVSGLSDANCMDWKQRPPIKVKIADFGMSRRLYSSQDYYTMDHNGALPIRWLPPESVLQAKFTYMSDMWSCGITLWECFTYGLVPYDGLSNFEVHSFGMSGMWKAGARPSCEHCPTEVYRLLCLCWFENPKWRITARQFINHPFFDDIRDEPVLDDDIYKYPTSETSATVTSTDGSMEETSFTTFLAPSLSGSMTASGYFQPDNVGKILPSNSNAFTLITEPIEPILASA